MRGEGSELGAVLPGEPGEEP